MPLLSDTFFLHILEAKMEEQTFILGTEDDYDFNYTYLMNLTRDPDAAPCPTQCLHADEYLSLFLLHIVNFFLAVPGNFLVGLVIFSSRQALTSSDIYLLHLMIADMQMALTVPFWAVGTLHNWIFGTFLCKFLSLVRDANFYTSILFLVCISVNRYLAIVHNADSRRVRSMACSRVICISVWVLGVSLSLPALYNCAFEIPCGKIICDEFFHIHSATQWRLVTRGISHIVGFLIPLTIMVACYAIVLARLLRTRGFQKHKAMRVIVAVVIGFLLCWTPLHITLMIDTLMRANLLPHNCAMRTSVDQIRHLTNCLALFHSCVNPMLYAFIGEKFRRNLVALMRNSGKPKRGYFSQYSRSSSQTSNGNRLI